MNLREAKRIVKAELLWGEELLDREVRTACGADLLSDVLAFTKDRTLLLTGLTNVQVVKTAEISDMAGIIFVRGKRPAVELLELAKERNLPLFVTELSMFESCGRLHAAGLRGSGGEES